MSDRAILFIAPSAYPLGGVATWLDYVVPGLREAGWNVTLGLVEGQFHDVDAYLRVHPDKQVLRIPFGTGTQEGRVRQLVQVLRRTQPDIVVSVGIADVVPAVDRIHSRSEWSGRIVVSLHAIQSEFIASISQCAKVLDAVVCTNWLACELVAKSSPVPKDRIFYAPCGVDLSCMTAIEPKIAEGILRIANVGRLERVQKRIEDLAAITAELDQRGVPYELMIAGGGPDEEWLRVQLSDDVIRGRVRFLGALTGTDLVDQVYSRADVLLITSLWETGPIVAWEAMANGVAVVTSAYIGSGLEGSLEPGENCLMFPIGEAGAAVDCLERLRDTDLRCHLIQGGYALLARRYSTTASIDQWNAALTEIAAKPPLSPRHGLPEITRPSHAGRLDRLFGWQVGETIRELLGLKYKHIEPGGEWPHTNFCSNKDEQGFWQRALTLDSRKPGIRTKGLSGHGLQTEPTEGREGTLSAVGRSIDNRWS